MLKMEERQLDGAPALMALFSEPLDSTILYENHIQTSQGGEPLSAAWVVGKNPQQLFLPHVEPQTRYEILFRAGLPALSGAKLARNARGKLTTKKVRPAFGFASSKAVLPASVGAGLPVMTVNVPEVDIQFFRIQPDNMAAFVSEYYLGWDGAPSEWRLKRMTSLSDLVYAGRFATANAPNAQVTTHIAVKQIPQLTQPGLYLAVMERPGKFDDYRALPFTITDIGINARAFAEHVEIFTQSLADGKALGQVELTLRTRKGKVIAHARTDSEGRARLQRRNAADGFLTAELGNQLSFLSFAEPALDLSAFPIDGQPHRPVELFAYLPRDLFRPGESFPLSVLARDHDGRPIAARPVSGVLLRPDGKEAKRFTLRPDPRAGELGYYEQTLELPADAATGAWRIALRADPADKQPTTELALKVEEFLPERMKLTLSSEAETLKPDQEWAISVQGDYLYGAPAAGNTLQRVVNRRFDPHPVKSLPKYFFGDASQRDKLGDRSTLDDVKLDAKGAFAFKLPPLDKKPTAPVAFKLSASLLESGGRPVTRSLTRTVWPAEALVGVRPLYSGDYAPSDQDLTIEIVRAAPDGSLLAAKGLAVTVIHEERQYHWSFSSTGWRVEYSDDHYPVLQRTLDIAAGAAAHVEVPLKWGSYRIEVVDPATGLKSLHRFEAGWRWNERAQSAGVRPDRVGLTWDRDAYNPGDVARLTLKPPHGGEALVLVEADRILWRKRVSLPAEGTVVEIPVDAAWDRHDIHATVLAFRPASDADRITPNRAMGVIHLPLDRSVRKVAVKLTAPAKMVPETTLSVGVDAPALKGKTAMVTVAAVDVGILNITDFTTPDPWSQFFGRKALIPRSYDLYGRIIELVAGERATLRFGGDADLSRMRRGAKEKAEVRLVSLFSGPVALDAEGHADVSLNVPDFNGSLRLMAVAFSADAFGSAESNVTVAAPLVAESSLPRFLSVGDESVMTLDLHNLSGQTLMLGVEMQAQAPLIVQGPLQVIELADQQRRVLTFPIATTGAPGVGAATVKVRGEGIDLTRRWPIAVRSPFTALRRAQEAIISANDRPFTLDGTLLAGLMPGNAELWLQLSPEPILNAREMFRGLVQYPYGCLEQTSSRTFPLLYVDEALAQRYGLKQMSRAERAEQIGKAFERLGGMWRPTGGYGLWSGDSPLEPWLSAYVGDLMQSAKERGFAVPEAQFKRTLSHLTWQLKGHRKTLRNAESKANVFAARAYAGYVLARLGRASLSDLRALAQHEQSDGAGLPRIHLGLALLLQGDQTRGLDLVERGVASIATKDAPWLHYGGPLRDTALAAALLKRHDALPEARAKLLVDLLEKLRKRRYLSTQEKLAAFLAAVGPALDAQAGEPRRVTLTRNGEKQTLELRQPKGLLWLDAQTWQDLAISPPESGLLHARATVTGYPAIPPAPVSEGLSVERDLFTMDGEAVDPEQPLQAGDLFVMHMTVHSDEHIEHGLLEARIPAGLELENPAVMKGETLADLELSGVKPAQEMRSDAIRHQEFREDRYAAAVEFSSYRPIHLYAIVRAVTPGTYTWPALAAEDMYDPETRAMGKTTTLTVIPATAP
ncbi:putative Alpha-2-macroglobulin, N-terminal:Alpha-2-macroglobulin, N-terminal 2 [Magnetofaba australis IT-1]|uniref:Putative Alpha-2-macroglobulin, N-terminal:Alpha-2-macroglobulin, N-terminal 2 n=1 Tax=Magnetofaba australis IT-1 TaxID=1434232 RepID=A0A1Y2K0M6_9PROT|nr:putative Alpha-2-macroglobulin, N-terminal:Alpha-2-macroglobulin, N-terminal 2 [Magnetofaba australis IT-1]